MLIELFANASDPSTLTTIGEISKAFLTPIIAIFAVVIGWSQYEASRYKIRLDLFDRRYKLYYAAETLKSLMEGNGTVTHKECREMQESIRPSKFLVDEELTKLLWKLEACAELVADASVQIERELPTAEVRSLMAKILDYKIGFYTTFAIIHEQFDKYLNFKDNFRNPFSNQEYYDQFKVPN